MKKLYSLLFILVCTLSFGQTIYSENMGTGTGTLAITATTFQNSSPITYSGTADTRSSLVSSGYVGASGERNVFITNTVGKYFQVDNINTSAYLTADIQMSFGYNTSSTTITQLVIEQSTDAGATWTPITFTPSATGWTLVTITGGQIPSSSTLSLRFSQPTTPSGQFRIDDLKLSNVSSSCTLSLGTPAVSCSATTLALDTYTVTIPYTGAGNATYTITTTGTISGDNPTSIVAGNIVVSFTEGTAYSINVTGGTCNFDISGNSPQCKPVNTLPFNEPFPYTTGNSLNSEQKWTSVNSGDNISVVSGNLSYTGVTSTGNSISFSADGAESRTLFTSTTSGTVYASFIATASDLANITNDLTNTYFALFTDNAGATTSARLWIRKNGSQYQYGLGTGTAPTDWTTALYNANDIQYLVLGYDFTNNLLSLFVNPTIGGSAAPTLSVTPTVAFANLGGFMLRQDGTATTPTMIIDELTIDTVTNFTLANQSFSIAGLTITPNPVNNGVFYINTDANAERTVTVFDVLGKQVLKTTTSDSAINVSNLTAGVYLVQVVEEGKTATKKLVIR